jgi:hypothetical protein
VLASVASEQVNQIKKAHDRSLVVDIQIIPGDAAGVGVLLFVPTFMVKI